MIFRPFTLFQMHVETFKASQKKKKKLKHLNLYGLNLIPENGEQDKEDDCQLYLSKQILKSSRKYSET